MPKVNKIPDARIQPHNLESEQCVLGCVLIDQDAAINIMSTLKSSDFYMDAHSIIFEDMYKVYANNMPVDLVTLMAELERNNNLDSVGGIEYLTTLANIVPSASNYNHYVEIVKRNSVLRQIIAAGNDIINYAYEGHEKDEAISYAEQNIFNIAEKEDRGGLTPVVDSLNNVIDKFIELEKNKGAVKGIRTGIYGLDKMTNGLQKSDLILLAARPGGGKTSLGMNIATYSALNDGKKVAIFSLEMSKEQIIQRAICSIAFVDSTKVKEGRLTKEDWQAIYAAKEKLAKADIYVDEGFSKVPADIISKCRRLKREKGLDLVMIDYLQLMQGDGKATDNRTLEIGNITRSLKMAARELDVPILLLSQLSRGTEGRANHRPMPSDLRDSGSIEQDADIIMFIYNPNMYMDDKNKRMVRSPEEMCELIVAKHRNGNTGTIEVKWIGGITTFVDVGPNAEEKSLSATAPAEYRPEPATPSEDMDIPEEQELVEASDITDDDLSDIF